MNRGARACTYYNKASGRGGGGRRGVGKIPRYSAKYFLIPLPLSVRTKKKIQTTLVFTCHEERVFCCCCCCRLVARLVGVFYAASFLSQREKLEVGKRYSTFRCIRQHYQE